MKGRSTFLALATFVGAGSCVFPCSAASDHAMERDTPGHARKVSAEGRNDDCTALSNISEREKCFALSEDFKTCPDTDLRCAPYRTMYVLDRKLQSLNDEILGLVRRRYASYSENDPAYLKDLTAYYDASDRAWKSSRDADCALEPFLQGMSRPETADLTEACRVDRTKARIDAMTEREAAFEK